MCRCFEVNTKKSPSKSSKYLGYAIEEGNCIDPELGDGVGGESVLTGGSLLAGGFEEEGHPMPSRAHKSPVVLGSG